MLRLITAAALAGGALLPRDVAAHGFSRLYTPPVPVALYGWAAAATLILSFVMAGLLATAARPPATSASLDLVGRRVVRALRHGVPVLRLLAVLVLVLCIVTGFWGQHDPARNFGLLFFWVIFSLLVPYLSLLLGNFYAALNPWRTLGDTIGRLWRGFGAGRIRYPEALGDWPALGLYVGFIAFELFGTGSPVPLAMFLTGYTALNLAGIWLVGTRAWFRHCEIFSVLLRLIALLAPIDYERGDRPGSSRLRLRWPCAGLLSERPAQLSSVVFALAMLSTTAFDGLRATQWWVTLFWADPSGLLTDWLGERPISAMATLRPWYLGWEAFWLFASPFLYLGAYLLTIVLARWLGRSARSVRALALDFGYSLLPIAVVYHISHYNDLLLAHGLKLISLVSDPFGWKWNLFGTAHLFRAPILPDYSVVWHSQVGMIVLGHVVSVFIAHRIALRVFDTRRAATLSQLPMLVLMIAFTVVGLWILAQPLTEMKMR